MYMDPLYYFSLSGSTLGMPIEIPPDAIAYA